MGLAPGLGEHLEAGRLSTGSCLSVTVFLLRTLEVSWLSFDMFHPRGFLPVATPLERAGHENAEPCTRCLQFVPQIREASCKLHFSNICRCRE